MQHSLRLASVSINEHSIQCQGSMIFRFVGVAVSIQGKQTQTQQQVIPGGSQVIQIPGGSGLNLGGNVNLGLPGGLNLGANLNLGKLATNAGGGLLGVMKIMLLW